MPRCFTNRLFYDMFIKTNCYGSDCVDGAPYYVIWYTTIEDEKMQFDKSDDSEMYCLVFPSEKNNNVNDDST